ncbi:uncharacterized protein LOC115705792 isoform X3 [Cannabis sativa]|uniref:uncharacterized protein LOC115705792 isoform X3 n=1 Tax=Cannabis sativa TaxID=3483 RepID=UPI0011DF5BB8|nr:uncharacterized protein LOC115705792 isoform X3 [Cannabis sativa]
MDNKSTSTDSEIPWKEKFINYAKQSQSLEEYYKTQRKLVDIQVIGLKLGPPLVQKEETRSVAAGSVCQYQVPSVQSHHRRMLE